MTLKTVIVNMKYFSHVSTTMKEKYCYAFITCPVSVCINCIGLQYLSTHKHIQPKCHLHNIIPQFKVLISSESLFIWFTSYTFLFMIRCNKYKSGVVKKIFCCSIIIVSDTFCLKQMDDLKENNWRVYRIGPPPAHNEDTPLINAENYYFRKYRYRNH